MTTKITTVSKLEFPSKRMVDGVGPRRVSSQVLYTQHKISGRRFEALSEKKSDLLARVLFIAILAGLALWAALTAYPAEAKTIELKKCRTNEECLRLYCEGAPNYVQDEKLTALCV